jgi:hypothetical protein
VQAVVKKKGISISISLFIIHLVKARTIDTYTATPTNSITANSFQLIIAASCSNVYFGGSTEAKALVSF